MEEAVDDIVHVPEWAAPPSPRARQLWRAIVLSVAYVAVYLVLDRISFIEPLHGINITPWNPSTGVMLALLIIKGVRWSPVVPVAELISDATLPQIPVLPAPLFVAAIVVTVGYASGAAILRHVRFDASLRRTSDVVVLLLAASTSSCLVATAFVATYAAAGVVPWTGFADAAFHYWIGDAIGIVVFTPPLLMITQSLALPAPTGRGRNWLQLLEVPAQGASIVAALAAVFLQIGGDHPLGVFYVLFLPLIWIATRPRCGSGELGSACNPSRVNRRVGDSGPVGGFASRLSTSDVRAGCDRPHARGGGQRAAPLVARPCRERKSSSGDPEYRAGWRPDDRCARKGPVDQPGGRTSVRASGQPADRTRRSRARRCAASACAAEADHRLAGRRGGLLGARCAASRR